MEFPAAAFYSIKNRTKFMVNNEFLSDCAFLVGIEKTKFYGHKQTLALGINYD